VKPAPLTRPRKARILEKAGLRYVAAWVPAAAADALRDEIEKGRIIEANALAFAKKAPPTFEASGADTGRHQGEISSGLFTA